MERIADTHGVIAPDHTARCADQRQASSFSDETITLTKQEHIELVLKANFWETQHRMMKSKLAEAKQSKATASR